MFDEKPNRRSKYEAGFPLLSSPQNEDLFRQRRPYLRAPGFRAAAWRIRAVTCQSALWHSSSTTIV